MSAPNRNRRLLAALGTVIALGAVACGGGVDDAADTTTADEASDAFADDVDALCADLFAEGATVSDALFPRLDELDFSDQQRVEDIATEFDFGADQLDGAVESFESEAAALDLPADVQQAVDDTAAAFRDTADTHRELAAAISTVDADQMRALSDRYSGELADRFDELATTFRSLELDGCAGAGSTAAASDTTGEASAPATTASTGGAASGGTESASQAFATAIDETGVVTTGAGYDTFETVTDDTGQLSIDVPPEWSDRSTTTTTPGSGNPEIIASTDLDLLGDGVPRIDVFVIHGAGANDVQDTVETMATGSTGAARDCQAGPTHVFEVENGDGAVQAYSDCNGTDAAWLLVAFTDETTDILTGLAAHAVTTADLDAIANAANSVNFTP